MSHEFVHQWQHNYLDTHQASVHVFEHFDMNRNGAICHDDIAALFTATDHTSKLVFFNKMVAINLLNDITEYLSPKRERWIKILTMHIMYM